LPDQVEIGAAGHGPDAVAATSKCTTGGDPSSPAKNVPANSTPTRKQPRYGTSDGPEKHTRHSDPRRGQGLSSAGADFVVVVGGSMV